MEHPNLHLACGAPGGSSRQSPAGHFFGHRIGMRCERCKRHSIVLTRPEGMTVDRSNRLYPPLTKRERQRISASWLCGYCGARSLVDPALIADELEATEAVRRIVREIILPPGWTLTDQLELVAA